jgi:hypothetical protein
MDNINNRRYTKKRRNKNGRVEAYDATLDMWQLEDNIPYVYLAYLNSLSFDEPELSTAADISYCGSSPVSATSTDSSWSNTDSTSTSYSSSDYSSSSSSSSDYSSSYSSSDSSSSSSSSFD